MMTYDEIREWRDRAKEISEERNVNELLKNENRFIAMLLTMVLQDD